jgi:hypothetical protein
MTCSTCGRALTDAERFCPSCGTPASDSNATTMAAVQYAVPASAAPVASRSRQDAMGSATGRSLEGRFPPGTCSPRGIASSPSSAAAEWATSIAPRIWSRWPCRRHPGQVNGISRNAHLSMKTPPGRRAILPSAGSMSMAYPYRYRYVRTGGATRMNAGLVCGQPPQGRLRGENR